MFTRRHHEAIAEVMAGCRIPLDDATSRSDFLKGAYAQWNLIEHLLSERFQADNERFKPEIFDAACRTNHKLPGQAT